MQDASMLWREMQIVITLRTGDHSLPRMDAHIWWRCKRQVRDGVWLSRGRGRGKVRLTCPLV